jgi:regulator of RNase E activity RraA
MENIIKLTNQIDKTLLKKLYKLPTASLCDALDSIGFKGFMEHSIKPILEGIKIVGPAVTIKDALSDKKESLMAALQAIDDADPGTVFVRASEGNTKDIALWGGLMGLASKSKKIEGAVLDGGVRDISELKEMKFQIFAPSVIPSTSIGRTKVIGINVPVTCGGVKVSPGDIIVGDSDGVVVIPADELEKVIEIAQKMDSIEKEEAEELRKGASFVETIKKFARV